MFHIFKTTAPVVEQPAPKSELDKIVEFAATAWTLPKDYFQGWEDRFQRGGKPFETVVHCRGVDEAGESQSPLHRIMDGCHEHRSYELREELWADKRYRRVIAWVFADTQAAAALEAAHVVKSHGYWRCMALTIIRAAEEGLIGLGKSEAHAMEV